MTQWIITSSVLILIIAVLRFLLRGKISLKLQYALWGLVLVRLILPFSVLESPASVLNLMQEREETYTLPAYSEPYVPEIVTPAVPDEDIFILDDNLEHIKPDTNIVIDDNGFVTEPEIRVISAKDILIPIWIGGIAVFGTVFAVSNLRFRKKLKNTREYVNGTKAWLPVYESSAVKTPCLFGAVKPAIYVTKEVLADEKVFSHVLEHETTHYRHGDHVWSVLRCFCLALHWYNPLVWLAAFLSMRDSELACDEDTIKRIGEEERIGYGRTLINLTCEKPAVGILSAATTMTGSKSSIRERIMLIAKKPKMLKITAAVVVLIAIVAVACTFTDAENYNPKTTEKPVSEQYFSQMEHSPSDYSDKTGKISMTVTKVSSDRIVTEVINKTECTFNYSIGYRLHFEQDGKWYELPMLDEYTSEMLFFSVDSHPISPNKTSGFGNDVQESYGKLPAGKYRILRTFKCFDEPDAESFVLAAEFTVSEPKGFFGMFSKGYSKFFPGPVGTEFLNGEKTISDMEVFAANVDSPVWNVSMKLSEDENKTLDEILDGYNFWYYKKGEKEEDGRWLYGINNPAIGHVQGTDVFYLGLGKNMVSPGISTIKVYENAVYVSIDIVSCKNPEDFSDETFDFGIDHIFFVSREKELVEKLISFCNKKTSTAETAETEENPTEFSEPEIIADHISALNDFLIGELGAEIVYEGTRRGTYLFNEIPENTDIVPDAVTFEKVYNGALSDGTYNGYYVDPFERMAYEVTNYTSKQEIYDYLEKYLSENLYKDDYAINRFFEIDGKLYYSFDGLPEKTYHNYEIVSQEEDRMVVSANVYNNYSQQWEGTAQIIFGKEHGNWIITFFGSVSDYEKNKARQIYNTEIHSEYLEAINEIMISHRNGTYEPVENHHPAYPEDFPSMAKFISIEEGNVALAWRETIESGRMTYEGVIDYIVVLDKTHAIILEPAEFEMADGTVSFGFANTGYLDAEKAGYPSVYEWMKDVYTDFYTNVAKMESVFGINEESGTPLTADEVRKVSEAFEAYRIKDNVMHVNVAANFLQGEFNRPEEINAAAFLYYFPSGMLITDEAEFEDLKKNWAFYGYTVPEGTTIEDYPVPLHKIPKSMVDEALEKYLGIGLEELRYSDLDSLAEGGIYYMEKYDCFYSTASDTHASRFVCESGEIFPDGTVVLYGESGATLILKKHPDGSYKLYAYQW